MIMIREVTINLTNLGTSESAKFIITTIPNNTITTKMIIAIYIGNYIQIRPALTGYCN